MDLTGFQTGTPRLVQRQTFEYVKASASELFNAGLAASRKTITDAFAGAPVDDLRTTGLSLHDREAHGFNLFMESQACADVAPGGVAVTFRNLVHWEAEILKAEETGEEPETAEPGHPS